MTLSVSCKGRTGCGSRSSSSLVLSGLPNNLRLVPISLEDRTGARTRRHLAVRDRYPGSHDSWVPPGPRRRVQKTVVSPTGGESPSFLLPEDPTLDSSSRCTYTPLPIGERVILRRNISFYGSGRHRESQRVPCRFTLVLPRNNVLSSSLPGLESSLQGHRRSTVPFPPWDPSS